MNGGKNDGIAGENRAGSGLLAAPGPLETGRSSQRPVAGARRSVVPHQQDRADIAACHRYYFEVGRALARDIAASFAFRLAALEIGLPSHVSAALAKTLRREREALIAASHLRIEGEKKDHLRRLRAIHAAGRRRAAPVPVLRAASLWQKAALRVVRPASPSGAQARRHHYRHLLR
jgi:hypothetical protein